MQLQVHMCRGNDHLEVSNDHIRRCQKDTSAGAENAGPEESKGSPNHTEMSDIYPIVSEQDPYTALPDPRDGASPEESRFDGYDANPNYKYTADYNKKYTFDIEKCLNHRMKLKAGEEYEVVEVDDDEKE